MGKGLGKIAAQTAANKETATTQAEMNMVNQVGPGGTTTYTQTGTSAAGNPMYTVEQKLTPELQAIQDQKTGLAGSTLTNAQGTLATPMNLGTGPTSEKVSLQTTAAGKTNLGTGYVAPMLDSKFGAAQLNTTGYTAPTMGTDFKSAQMNTGYQGAELGTNFDASGLNTDFTQQGQDIIYDLGRERLDPRFQQEEAALEQQLANQGIRPGMEAYNRAKTQFAQQKNDAYTQLMMQGLQTAAGISKDQFAAGLSQNQFNSSQLSQQNQAKLLQAGITNEQLQLINQGKEAEARLSNEQLQLVNQAKQTESAAKNQQLQMSNEAKLAQTAATNQQAQLANEAKLAQANAANSQVSQMNQAQLQQAQLDLQRQQQENAAALQQAQQNNDAAAQDRARQVQEQLATRQQAIQEAQAATTMGQVAPIGTVNTPQVNVAPVDAAGIMQNQQALDQQRQNALIGGIGSAAGTIGGAAIMSDRRVKTDAKRVGKLDDGTPVHAYRYKGSPLMQIGVMAQEIQDKHPKAVSRNRRGLMAVDYGRLAREVA